MKNNQTPRVLSFQSNYMHEMMKQRSKLLVTCCCLFCTKIHIAVDAGSGCGVGALMVFI